MIKKKSLYDPLGVDKNASKEEIKKAYRDKSKETHPDKKGNADEFKEIARAYSILSVDAKRKRYDTTGNENPEREFEQKFMGLANQTFMQLMEQVDIHHTDLVAEFKDVLKTLRYNMVKERLTARDQIEKYEEVKKRLKSKGNQAIIVLLDGGIQNSKERIANLEEEIDFFDKAIEVAQDYDYNFDKPDTIELTFNSVGDDSIFNFPYARKTGG